MKFCCLFFSGHRPAFGVLTCALFLGLPSIGFAQSEAPSTYSAYTGTDTKTIPPAPPLGTANSVITDPTFGSQILRVTDTNSNYGESFVSTDSGFHRAWNADSTAIKLTGPHGDGWWLEFNAGNFTVGDGSSNPVPHPVPFGATWEWSSVDPNIIYFLNGNQIASYNKATGVQTNLGGPPNGDPVTYSAVVIGQDNWVCSAAGPGQQDTYTEIYCVNPTSPATSEFIDVYNQTINGVPQGDPNWPTSAPGQVIGIHEISGGTGSRWLEVTFHTNSWGANGGAVLDLGTNTWSEITNADIYWSGHVSMGNGTYANSAGSIDGDDSRGIVLRNPDNAMNSSQYQFVSQPPEPPANGWCDSDHISWLNSMTNPGAPILVSRYFANEPNCAFAWTGEIYAAAVDGSNTVWRFAHNHNGGDCYYGEGFVQISNDGNWALFSSYWDGTLGPDTSFGCQTRIDTFIVHLNSGSWSSTPPPQPPTVTTTSLPDATENVAYSTTLAATAGTPPYTWSIASGLLPAGLTLGASSGIISGTPTGSGTSTFNVQVADANAQQETATLSLTINPANSTTTIFFPTTMPTTFNVGFIPLELGVKFSSDVNGTITGVRFYKGVGDTSVHTGSLWSSTGALLATGTFSGETSSGWQQLNFSTPVAIMANTIYVASYHSGGDFYYSFDYFANSGVDNPPLHALQDGVSGPNGVYILGSGGVFPTQSSIATNYWVDIVFAPQ